MIKLDQETEEKVQAALFEANQQFNNYETENSLQTLRDAIALFPDKPERCHLGWSLFNQICEYAYEDGVINVLDEFIPRYAECDSEQRGFGTSDFLIAKISFDRGEFDKAKNFFEIANRKSEGRVWKQNKLDPKYLDFFKNSFADSVRPTEFNEILNLSLRKINQKEYSLALSLLYDCLNLRLDNSTVHFNKGLCHFELDELDHAADSFTRAYMLEGEDIFKGKDSKYFDFLKTKIDIK